MTATCLIQPQQFPGLVVVTLTGRIDETFPGDELLSQLTGDAVINLGLVHSCTSFGISRWLSAMREIQTRQRHCVLVECSPAVVSQLNTVFDFALGTHVKSVQLPYSCDACATGTVLTVDVDAERDALLRGELPRPRCNLCAISMRFDEMAEDYFSFLRGTRPPPLGSGLADFIARFESATSAPAGSAPPGPGFDATLVGPDPANETDFGMLGGEEEESPTTPGEPIPALLAMAVRPVQTFKVTAPATLLAALEGAPSHGPRDLMTPFEEDVAQLASAYVDNGTTAPGLPGPEVLALAGVPGSPEAAAALPAAPGSAPSSEDVPFVITDVTTQVARPAGLGPPPRRSAPAAARPIARGRGTGFRAPGLRLGLAAGALLVLGLGFGLAMTVSAPPPALREATALEIVELNALLARDRFDAAEELVRGISGQLEEPSRVRLFEIIQRDRQNAVEGHRARALDARVELRHREAISELKQAIALGGPNEELMFLQVTLNADARDCRGLRTAADEFERAFPVSIQAERVSQARESCREAPPVVAAPPRPVVAAPNKLSQSEIVEVAVQNRPALVDCIQKHLSAQKGHGKLEMEWTVLPNGKVIGVRCNTRELRSSPLVACITPVISAWSFPSSAARKNQQVHFPFKF